MGGPSTDQVVLWVQFLVAAGSSHTKYLKNGSGPGPCLHATHDEAGTKTLTGPPPRRCSRPPGPPCPYP